LYEAIESGSIPIIRRIKDPKFDFITNELGKDPPFIIIDSWSDLKDKMRQLEGTSLDALQARMFCWWRRTKMRLQQSVKKMIDESFEREYGVGS